MPKDLHQAINFRVPIHKVFRELYRGSDKVRVSARSANDLSLMVHFITEKLAETCNQLKQHSKTKKTVDARIVQNSIRLMLRGELAKHAISNGTKAVTKYASRESVPSEKTKISQAKRAGLTFPVARFDRLIRTYLHSNSRLGAIAVVYLTAVVEYILAEIIELSINVAKDLNRKMITSRHIYIAISRDADLSHLFREFTFVK